MWHISQAHLFRILLYLYILFLGMKELIIENLSIRPINVGLTDTFTISQGSVPEVQSLLVALSLNNGVTGYGEITPFPELAGENRENCEKRFSAGIDHLNIISMLISQFFLK